MHVEFKSPVHLNFKTKLMKPVNYIVRIPEPCSEDWNKMQADEKGKFCGSCSKSVFDFSNKTDNEIQNILMKHKNQKVCGHFKKTQVNRPLNFSFDVKNLPRNVSVTTAFAIALFLVFGTLLFSCTDANNKKIESIELVNPYAGEHILGEMMTNPIENRDTITEDLNENEISAETFTTGESMISGGLSFEEVQVIEDSTYKTDTVITEPLEYRTTGLMAIEIVQEDSTVTEDSTLTDSLSEKNKAIKIGDNVISKNTDLSIYPNPTSGEFTIKYDVNKRADIKIEIYNTVGAMVKTVVDQPNQYEGRYQIPINLSDLPSGIYFVNLSNNGKSVTEKVVIEK